MSLSICLWKQKGSQDWEEIERCYAYAGHKDGVVKCKWKETLFGKQERKKIRKIRKKVKGKTSGLSARNAASEIIERVSV